MKHIFVYRCQERIVALHCHSFSDIDQSIVLEGFEC